MPWNDAPTGPCANIVTDCVPRACTACLLQHVWSVPAPLLHGPPWFPAHHHAAHPPFPLLHVRGSKHAHRYRNTRGHADTQKHTQACTHARNARTHARLQAVASYQEFSGRQNIFVEYVLLAGVNDGAPDACLVPPSLCGLLLVARRGPGAWIACACQCWGQCSRLLAIRPHSCPSPEAVRLCASPVAGVQHAHELGTLLRGLKVLLNLIPWVSGGLVGLCGCGGRLCLVAWVGGGR